jgi:hypothetical protein
VGVGLGWGEQARLVRVWIKSYFDSFDQFLVYWSKSLALVRGRGPTGPEMQRKVVLLCTAFHSVTAVITTATCFNPGWLCATDFNCPRANILAFTPLAVLRSPAAQRPSTTVTGIKSTKAVAERPEYGFKSCEGLFNLEVSEKIPGPQYYKHTKQMKQNVNYRIEYDRHQDNPRW